MNFKLHPNQHDVIYSLYLSDKFYRMLTSDRHYSRTFYQSISLIYINLKWVKNANFLVKDGLILPLNSVLDLHISVNFINPVAQNVNALEHTKCGIKSLILFLQ